MFRASTNTMVLSVLVLYWQQHIVNTHPQQSHNSATSTGISSNASAPSGNVCPESEPWPCKTRGVCLSFDFICDGEVDCPDAYDEDATLCVAKGRPADVILENFILKWQHDLIPHILGPGTPRSIARALVESPTIQDYVRARHLTREEEANFRKVMEGVRDGRLVELTMAGVAEESWNEVFVLFGRIVKSGFLAPMSPVG